MTPEDEAAGIILILLLAITATGFVVVGKPLEGIVGAVLALVVATFVRGR